MSHEAIYQAIYVQARGELRKELASCLRTGRARRAPKGAASGDRGHIVGMINISERPAEAADRAVPGHWEGDLIIGANAQARWRPSSNGRTRMGMLIKLENSTAEHVTERLAENIVPAPRRAGPLAHLGPGQRARRPPQFTVATGVPVYFCDPHSPWQRGSNENWNGLVRQFLPKGTDLSKHTQDELDQFARLLNGRPRKTLTGILQPNDSTHLSR